MNVDNVTLPGPSFQSVAFVCMFPSFRGALAFGNAGMSKCQNMFYPVTDAFLALTFCPSLTPAHQLNPWDTMHATSVTYKLPK